MNLTKSGKAFRYMQTKELPVKETVTVPMVVHEQL